MSLITAVEPGDSVIAFNFRPDRMREITSALCDPAFAEVDRAGVKPVSNYSCLTEYEEGWPYAVAFEPERPLITLPQVIANNGGRQLHVAETEKYPHVTYFFAGGDEHPQDGERRELVASNREVATYDESPQMSAQAASEKFVAAWQEEQPEFAIINFANPDMVGHTGVIPAAVTAIETVDRCLGEIVAVVKASGGELLITADHGNADEMFELDKAARPLLLNGVPKPRTSHSLNPVPFVLVDPLGEWTLADLPGASIADASIANIGATLLVLRGLTPPADYLPPLVRHVG